MIVRILNEGQYEVPDAEHEALAVLDAELEAALETNDAERFNSALAALAEAVRAAGTELDPATILPSDLAVPPPGSTIDEVRQFLASEHGGAASTE